MPYRTIDLFAGIGGIRKGFELAGDYTNILSAEIDKYACETYEHLYSENPFNDVSSEDFKQKVKLLDYDVLLAGFPCQTFSRAGKKQGFHNDTKGTLFFEIADIIERTRPKAFFLENVDHLITHDKGATFHRILEILVVELNYKVIGVSQDQKGNLVFNPKNFIRNSKHFGVPQNRPRVYIIGFDRKLFGDKVNELPNMLPISSERVIYHDLSDVLEMNAELKYFMSSGYLETLEKHKERQKTMGNGFGYKIVNSPDIEHPIANTLLATGGSGKERNLVIDLRPNTTGTKVHGKHSPLNNKHVRTMTPREWGKLQGFINYAFVENGVDKFSFPASIRDGQKYKQFGNSVTIPVVEEMAFFIKKCLKELSLKDTEILANQKFAKNGTA